MGWYHLVLRIWMVHISVTEVCSSTLGRAMLHVKYQDLVMSDEFSLENTSGSLEQHLDESSHSIIGISLRESSRSHENIVIKESSQNLGESSLDKLSHSLEESSLEKLSKSLEESSLEKSSEDLEESPLENSSNYLEESSLEKLSRGLEESLEKLSKSVEQSSLEKSSQGHVELSLEISSERVEKLSLEKSSQSLEESSNGKSSQSLEESSNEKLSQSLTESSNEKTSQSLKESFKSSQKASRTMEDKIDNTNKISQSSEKISSTSHEEYDSSVSNDSGKSKREAAAVLSFKSLDDLIDGIEAQVKLGDESFEFTADQEIVINAGIEKIKKSITEGDSVEKMTIFIKELETTFSELTGYNIEMSFITQLRVPTVMNEALKQMFIWINMMMSGTIEFSALESKITAYLVKLKANPDMDPKFLAFLDGIVLKMKSKDLEAGKETLLEYGKGQQSYLPADISPHVTTMEDIINAVEKVCEVKLDDEMKSELNAMISELQIAITEKRGEKELATLLHHLERKLKSVAKRTFDLSFLLDLELGAGGLVVDQTDWKSISVSLIEILLNAKNLPADQVITEIKVWISKTLANRDLLPEVKIRLEVLLEQIEIETTKNTEPGQLLIILKQDIEEASTFDANDLSSIIVVLKGIISNPGNLPPNEVIKDMKILISKALVTPDLSPEIKLKFQIFMAKIEEETGNDAEPADIFKNLAVIVDSQLSGAIDLVESCEDGWRLVGSQCFIWVKENRKGHDAKSYCENLPGKVSLAQPDDIWALHLHMKEKGELVGNLDYAWYVGAEIATPGVMTWFSRGLNIPAKYQDNPDAGTDGCIVLTWTDMDTPFLRSISCTTGRWHICGKDARTFALPVNIRYMENSQYEEIWNPKGSGGKKDISIWRSVNHPPGFYSLGDVAHHEYSQPSFTSILVSDETLAAVHPTGFTLVWIDKGSKAHIDGAVYTMIAPPGYTCLGGVAMRSHTEQPDKNRYCCIRDELLVLGELVETYTDVGTGASTGALKLWNVVIGSDARGISGGNFLPVYDKSKPSKGELLNSEKATKGSSPDEVFIPDVTDLPLETEAPLQLTTTQSLIGNNENLFEVNFLTCGGHADATTTWDKNWLPSEAFRGGAQGWHSGRGSQMPQSLWYEFVEPASVVKVSFSSRNDLRPIKYKFWGSNGPAFDDPKSWTILFEDTALSKDDKYAEEFSKHEKQQAFVVKSPQKFLAYGFQVIETRCKYCSIKNVHFFTSEPLKELARPNEEIIKSIEQIKEIQEHMINRGIDESETLKKISAQLAIINHMANLQQLELEVAETLPGLQKEIDILLSMDKLDKLKLIVRIQPLYRILISCTRVLNGEASEITGDEFRLNIKLLRMFINKARKEPENLKEWLFFIRTQVLFININRQGHSDEVIKDWKEIFRLINNIVSDDVNGCLHILEVADDLCKEVLEGLGESKLAEELKSLELVIRRIFVKLEKEAGKMSSVAIFSQMKPWLLLIISREEANGAFSEEATETCKALVEMINHINDFETSYADEYYKFLVRFNIIGWLLNDIENKPPSFTMKDFIQTVEEMDIFWAISKDLLEDQKSLMNFKTLMMILTTHSSIMKIQGLGKKIDEIIIRILIILKEKMEPYEDMKDAKNAALSIRIMVIRLAYHLKLSLKNLDFTIKFGSSEYYFELNDKLEHRLAAEACVEMGGHLARPGRKDLEQLIEHAKKHTDRINLYLDATDTKKENFYQYATGKELPSEDLWEPNEPNNKGGKQHCVAISKLSSNRLLNDVECDSPQQYICQIGESEHDPIPECTTVGDGCYVYDKRKRNWHDAEKECKAMGGIYASPCKKQLDLLIKHTVSIGGRYWIGAYEIEKAKKYIYVKGTKMPCGFWGSGEPNGHGGIEKCVEISSTTKALNDLQCKIDLQFICQFGEDGCNEEKDRAERAKNCVKIEDSCYVIETEETLTWEEAKKEANLYPSGQLAAPDRNEMRRLIDHVSKLGGRYWIGANDRATEGSYHYDDQEHKMPGGFWGNGEPKGTDDDEDCVEINAKKKGLADMPCSTEINYIVEIIDPSAPPKGTDKPECSKFGSSCFWINEWDELTWEEAKKACEKTGGYLASPTRTAATKGLLESLHKIGGKYWTGATDSKKEGEYKYVTGNLMIEGLWVPGEPNQGHKNQEDCIGIWSKKKGFYDENCDAKLNYICQYGEIEPQVPEPKNCETIGTGCFIIEDSMKIDWNAAKAKCESVGAKLAHPTKEQMEGLLKHLHPKGDCWWIGGSDTSKEGHWVYVNGENMPGGFWNTGEPNNCGNGEGCVEINASHQKLNDIPCNTKHPYVCQVENPGVIPKPVTESPEPGCKHEVIGSSCFMIEPDDKLTWTAAQKHCEGLGMTLAAPTNEDLQILLTHMAHKGGRYWIGAREYDNTFKFSSGSEVPCVWGPGHPEYKDDQKCVEIYAKYKSLSDGKCDTERNFICQDLTN